jgi:hypothetical protein
MKNAISPFLIAGTLCFSSTPLAIYYIKSDAAAFALALLGIVFIVLGLARLRKQNRINKH